MIYFKRHDVYDLYILLYVFSELDPGGLEIVVTSARSSNMDLRYFLTEI